jgi:hypothetical protein
MMGRMWQRSRRFGMSRTARENAIGSSGEMSKSPEYYWKSENGAA